MQHRMAEFSQKYTEVKAKIEAAKKGGNRVVFCDATLFDTNTITDVAWPLPNNPLALPKVKLRIPQLFNVLAGVSEEYGVEYW